jgi:hypothetical protein
LGSTTGRYFFFDATTASIFPHRLSIRDRLDRRPFETRSARHPRARPAPKRREPMSPVTHAHIAPAASTTTDGQRLAGRILTGLVVLFMVFDGAMKVLVESHVVTAMAELGWPADQSVGLGVLILACTAVYAVPRTAVLGGVLLTGFLGGATAAQVRIGHPWFFSVGMGVLVWLALYLRDARVRALAPWK